MAEKLTVGYRVAALPQDDQVQQGVVLILLVKTDTLLNFNIISELLDHVIIIRSYKYCNCPTDLIFLLTISMMVLVLGMQREMVRGL